MTNSALEDLKQPKPFYMIFFLEAWERFGFYGMQAILVLYMVKELNFTQSQSFNTFGAFTALVYALVSVGGYIGDRVLGTKRTIVIGALFLALGYFLLGLDNITIFYYGLGFIVVGNGLFKANPSSLLSKCYEPGDPKLDGAFTLYYMAINLGSFVSMSILPYIAAHSGWGWGFWTCSGGLVLAVLNYFGFYKWVKHIGSKPGLKPMKWHYLFGILLASIAVAIISAFVLKHLTIAHWILTLIGIAVLITFIILIKNHHGIERSKLIVALVLMFQAIVFFIIYLQMPTSLNFFVIQNVHHNILGFHVNPLSFQALNPFWIIIASPILAYLYSHFGNQGKDLAMPTKFSIGILLCALGYLVLVLGCHLANSKGVTQSIWVVISYLFQSVGELMVSGLGLAMVARLVPQRLMGLMMGIWFMTTAAAFMIGGFVADLTTTPHNVTNPLITLPIYSRVFLEIGLVTLVISCLMFSFAPKLTRMIGD